MRNLYEELQDKIYKPITFKLYNKIDDDYIPQFLSKQHNEIYGIDDFEYCNFDLDKKEKFLFSMHNKEFLQSIKRLKDDLKDTNFIVEIDFNDQEVYVIKLKKDNLTKD